MDGLLILKDLVFWTISIFKDMINLLPDFYSQETCIYTNWSSFTQTDFLFPLDCKEIKPVSPKGNQPSMFFGRTDAESEAPILWAPNAKNRLLGKDPDAGKDWRWEEKGMAKMRGWMASLTWWTWVWVGCGELVMDREAWSASVHEVAKSQTWLSN